LRAIEKPQSLRIVEDVFAMSHYWHELWRHVDHMGSQDWLLVLAAMIGVAFVCMRGFGSRSQY
jgi:hypothetical protein